MMSPPFEAISLAALDDVNGGRMLQRTGPDPTVVTMIQQLVESIKTVSTTRQQEEQQKQQQMSGLMQQMMQKRMG